MLTPIRKAADLFCIAGSAYISQSIVFSARSAFSHIDGLVGLLGLMFSFITFHITKVYRPFRDDSSLGNTVRTLLAWLTAQLALIILSHAYPGNALRLRWLLCWTVITACALIAERLAIDALPSLLRCWRFAPTRIAIVATGAADGDLLARIAAQTRHSFVPEVIFDPALPIDKTIHQVPALCQMKVFKQFMRLHGLREVWIITSPLKPISVENLIDEFRDEFINIRVLPLLDEIVSSGYRGVPVLNVVAAPDYGWDTVPKEIFDRAFSLFMLLGISPALFAIAIAIKLSSPGPVLFRQYRKGMNGDIFSIYKFRTMYQGADKAGTVVQARKDDARVTRLGRFLRRTSLDELPQFFNVLKGEMSVVGPRPHAVEHDEYYKDLVQHYMFRYRIKPGITGWAQVNGYRGETDQIEKMQTRVRLDMYYIQHWTFWLDLKIIALTLIKGFVGENAY